MKFIPAASVALSACLLAACASTPDDAGVDGIGADDPTATTTGIALEDPETGQPIDPESIAGRAPQERVIYFDFDRAEIRPEYLDIVGEHGRFLANNPDGRVRLEGHTDERGTREYNIALGEERAKSVQNLLELQGVLGRQIQVVSYGEELPVDEGHDSEAWAKNRRVNIIYAIDAVPN